MTAVWWWILACRPPAADGPPRPHSGEPTSDTGGPSAHTAAETGAPSTTADTGASPVVLPACDLPPVPLSDTSPVRRSVDELRSAWMQGGDPSESNWGGVPVQVLNERGSPSLLAVGIQHKAVFFHLPLRGEFTLSQGFAAANWGSADADYERWARGDWSGDGRDDVLVAQQAIGGPSIVTPPIAPGIVPVQSMAAVALDTSATLGLPRFDTGDWNGDGQDDLLVAVETGDFFLGNRYPPAPYPLGGAGIYLGPLTTPRFDVLDESAPAAWYDAQPWDVFPEWPQHSGLESRLLDDVDGDGKDDVLLSGYEWHNLADRFPPEPNDTNDPPNMGGFAVFSGGLLGANLLGTERTLLAAVCHSDQIDTFALDSPTMSREVGDVDGDGIDDLALIADNVDLPNGKRDAVFLVTRLPSLTGLHTYTEASGAVIINAGDVGGSFQDAVSIGDLNGDGIGDLALSNFDDGIYVFLSPLSGFLDVGGAALKIVRNDDGSPGFAQFLAFGDVDGDGLGDLVATDEHDRNCCGAVHVISGQAMRSALGL